MYEKLLEQLTITDFIEITGILASLITSIVAICISVKTLKQNALMIEESTRAIIGIYGESINTGAPMFYIVIKNFGNSQAIIKTFEYDYNFSNCYDFFTDRDILKTDLINCSISPGQSRICKLKYESITRPITFDIEYESCGKLYKDSMTIDLRSGSNMIVSKVATSNKELRTISYTLQEMLAKRL